MKCQICSYDDNGTGDGAHHCRKGSGPVIDLPAPADRLTDAQIEHIFLSYLGKWNGSEWRIEDANLHPFVRDCLAQSARQGACDVLDAARWRFVVLCGNEKSAEHAAMGNASEKYENNKEFSVKDFEECVDLAMKIMKDKND